MIDLHYASVFGLDRWSQADRRDGLAADSRVAAVRCVRKCAGRGRCRRRRSYCPRRPRHESTDAGEAPVDEQEVDGAVGPVFEPGSGSEVASVDAGAAALDPEGAVAPQAELPALELPQASIDVTARAPPNAVQALQQSADAVNVVDARRRGARPRPR